MKWICCLPLFGQGKRSPPKHKKLMPTIHWKILRKICLTPFHIKTVCQIVFMVFFPHFLQSKRTQTWCSCPSPEWAGNWLLSSQHSCFLMVLERASIGCWQCSCDWTLLFAWAKTKKVWFYQNLMLRKALTNFYIKWLMRHNSSTAYRFLFRNWKFVTVKWSGVRAA